MSQHDAHVQCYFRLKLERMRAEAGLEAPVDKIGRRLFHLAVLGLKEERKAAAGETEEEKGYPSVKEFVGFLSEKPGKPQRQEPTPFRLISSNTPPDTGDSSVATTRNRLLNKMRGPIPLRGSEQEHFADLLFARLHAAAPWMAALTDSLLKAARVGPQRSNGRFQPRLHHGGVLLSLTIVNRRILFPAIRTTPASGAGGPGCSGWAGAAYPSVPARR